MSLTLTPEKAEIIGALLGDKTRFGFFKRYQSWVRRTTPRGVLEISLGADRRWGIRLSSLAYRAYGLRGCSYRLRKPPPRQPEWRFRIDSSRVVRDLAPYFDARWKAESWRVAKSIFNCSVEVVSAVLRGYMDADGYVHTSQTKGVRVDSINESGLRDIQRLFAELGIGARLYAMRTRKSWILQITRRKNVSRYARLVGFSMEHKARALGRIISY